MFQDILKDFTTMQVLPFDDAAGSRFETLRQQRVRIGTMDLRIASIALERGHTVLTRNLVDFEKVPGLAAEDWTRP
jgi:tRNA(fMet)-specific endonuclease VapC